jgi:hypothetical protein
MNTTASSHPLRKRDWVRFQIKSSRIVLEGFIQQIPPDGNRLLIGNAPDSTESDWYSLQDIAILHHQSR